MSGCFECGQSEDLHNHHVVPRAMGGTKTVQLCGECHGKIHEHIGLISTSVLTSLGMAEKKRRGEHTGTIPYGFSKAPDGIHVIENEVEMQICEICLSLRKRGVSFRVIAKKLDDDGYMSRTGKWHPETIRRIIDTAREREKLNKMLV